MLTIPQVEALRRSNPYLYEALKRIVSGLNAIGVKTKINFDTGITDGATYARVQASALTAGNIDPTKSGMLMKGSVPPTWNGAFTYVSTTSSITWSWSGLTIYRADSTTTAVPNGSLAVTGLTAGTTYYFYPYWDDVAGAIGWVAGGLGSPANAQSAKTNFAAQQQSLQGRIPLSQGAMVAATTNSGTGGGSGGGSGSCLRSGMVVLSRERGTVPIESCRAGAPSMRRFFFRRLVPDQTPPDAVGGAVDQRDQMAGRATIFQPAEGRAPSSPLLRKPHGRAARRVPASLFVAARGPTVPSRSSTAAASPGSFAARCGTIGGKRGSETGVARQLQLS